jgi:hypothetical protein
VPSKPLIDNNQELSIKYLSTNTTRYFPVLVESYPFECEGIPSQVDYRAVASATLTAIESAREASAEQAAVSKRTSYQQYSSSLGTVVRITDTELKQPSDIAYDSLKKLKELPDNHPQKKYHRISEKFCKYLDDCEKKKFHLQGYDTKTGKFVHAPLDYDNRWNLGRRRELSQKLDQLECWFELQVDRPVTMITLTSYQEGLSISSAWENLNKSRCLLLKLIRKYFGMVDYFWVVEPHKSGYIHYHLAVFEEVSNNVKDNKGKGIEDKLRDFWSRKYKTGNHTYGLQFSRRTDNQKIKGLKDYLTKYLRKGFLIDTWSIGMLLFNAHLWDTGYRMYGASKNISAIMKPGKILHPQTVWLEMKIEDENGEGHIVKGHYRLYIPDWLDSDFWLYEGKLRQIDPPVLYIYDWGRKLSENLVEVVHRWQDLNITPRNHNVSVYDRFRAPS